MSGVIAELLGVALLIGLLAAHIRRGPAVLFAAQGGEAQGTPLGFLAPFLASSLMASYVMYGFDTAGSLAEETDEPRRRAPWAILQALAAAGLAGGLLILFGILAVSDPGRPELGQIHGGLPFLIKDVLGPRLGTFLLVEVVFAIFVCALAVQAGSVRLVFAMARDNNLPFAHALSHVAPRTRAPIVPSVVIGLLAATILVLNINMPHVIETLCAVAIVWANLAYLMVTFALLVARLRPRGRRDRFGPISRTSRDRDGYEREPQRPLFSLGIFGLAGQHRRGPLGRVRCDQRRLAPARDLRRRTLGAIRSALCNSDPDRIRQLLFFALATQEVRCASGARCGVSPGSSASRLDEPPDRDRVERSTGDRRLEGVGRSPERRLLCVRQRAGSIGSISWEHSAQPHEKMERTSGGCGEKAGLDQRD